MKQLLSLITALIMILTLCSCGKNNDAMQSATVSEAFDSVEEESNEQENQNEGEIEEVLSEQPDKNERELNADTGEEDAEDNTDDSTTISITEKTYLEAINATKSDLTGSEGKWYYKGIPLLSEDCEWIDNPINVDGTVSQGVVYRKFAYMLDMSDFEKGRFLYSYKDISEILFGYIPETVDDYIPLGLNASEFIVTEDQIQTIMKKLQSLESVSGEFDFEYQKLGEYSVDITDLSACANEMQISEEMLGYILAMLDEYGPRITFEENSCHIEYESRLPSGNTQAESAAQDGEQEEEGIGNDSIFDAEGYFSINVYKLNAYINDNLSELGSSLDSSINKNDDNLVIYVKDGNNLIGMLEFQDGENYTSYMENPFNRIVFSFELADEKLDYNTECIKAVFMSCDPALSIEEASELAGTLFGNAAIQGNPVMQSTALRNGLSYNLVSVADFVIIYIQQSE